MRETMFERVGGFARVRLLVSDFYDKVLESERLGRYFETIDMRRLVDHQTKFLAAVMGGPASFSDAQLTRSHTHLGITDEEFDEMAELLEETLEDGGLADADVERLIAHVESLRKFVTSSNGTGEA